MEEVDKGYLTNRVGVSVWMFLLVPAYLGSPGQRAVKQLCVCVCVYEGMTSNGVYLSIDRSRCRNFRRFHCSADVLTDVPTMFIKHTDWLVYHIRWQWSTIDNLHITKHQLSIMTMRGWFNHRHRVDKYLDTLLANQPISDGEATDHCQKGAPQDGGLPELIVAWSCLTNHSEASRPWLVTPKQDVVGNHQWHHWHVVCCNIEDLNFGMQNLRATPIKHKGYFPAAILRISL